MAAYEATHEIAKALAGETDLDVILDLVVKRGRALVEARCMYIGLVERDEVVVVNAAGQLDRSIIGRRVPLHGSLTGRVVRLRRAQRLTDLGEGTTFMFQKEIDARAALLVPLLLRGRAIGVLAAFDRLQDGPAFGAEDERLMEAFASSAAHAVATGRRSPPKASSAPCRRRRTNGDGGRGAARRDAAGHRGPACPLGSARQTRDPGELGKAVDVAVERLAEQADTLRSLITELHPAALDKLGVAAAIDALVERVRRQSSLDVAVDVNLDAAAGGRRGRLAPAAELAIYRTVQEALTNVVRHAGASTVEIEIRGDAEHVRVRVSDDGLGFDDSEDRSGFGLVGMRERAALLDGDLVVRSKPGLGTTVELVVPALRPGDPARAIA
jgi:two-component sensor histidine kinase